MTSTTSTAASRLSFDVLGIIFSYYAQEETIFHPLETLLLVCKSWNDAGLGHRALWTRLAIHIKHSSSHKIWRARLPLRLERGGTSLPLHIDLRNMLLADPAAWGGPQHAQFEYEPCIPTPCSRRIARGPETHCPCVEDGFLCIDELLLNLAGPEGNLCRRWKTLHLELPYVGTRLDLKYKQLQTVLAYPMPILASLISYGVHDIYKNYQPRKFPSTPSLKSLSIDFAWGAMPSFRTVHWMSVIDPHFKIFISPGSRPILRDVENVEELVLHGEFILPESMRKLRALTVTGTVHWISEGEPDLPSLTHLSLQRSRIEWLSNLVQSPTVDLSRLVSFGFHWSLRDSSNLNLVVVQLLRRTKALAIIHGDSTGLAFILTKVWETAKEEESKEGQGGRLLAGQKIRLELEPDGHCAMLRGDESRRQLRAIADALGIFFPVEGEDA